VTKKVVGVFVRFRAPPKFAHCDVCSSTRTQVGEVHFWNQVRCNVPTACLATG
jgi:hypothetical protein